MPTEFNTLEEARAEILRLNGEVSRMTTEAENYRGQISTLENDLERVRTINQDYFLQLQQQYHPNTETGDKGDKDDKHDVPSCEDFAKTLTI